MRYSDIEKRRSRKALRDHSYKFLYYKEFNYEWLNYVLMRKQNGKRSATYAEAYIMLDTETSKEHDSEFDEEGKMIIQPNHICAFTCSIRAFHTNIVTLRGSRPSELVECLKLIRSNIKADKVYIFIHNASYDWPFIRRFLFKEFGYPVKQLNTKSHYPVSIEFENGIILRDSYILAGVSLEKWAENLEVEHKKAVGSWDYSKIRNQDHIFTDDELRYIECDTLAGVECLNKLADNLGDTVVSLPLTLTGIVRRRIRQEGKRNYAKQDYNRQLVSFEDYLILERVYHGGYTHSNRHIVGFINNEDLTLCRDFKSSYPFCMLTMKAPCEAFYHMQGPIDLKYILSQAESRSFIFKFIAVNVRLKDPDYPMPVLQFAKCESVINVIKDNGRILSADYIEIYVNEIDMLLIDSIYTWDEAYAVECMTALKDYLPDWYRAEVWNIFREKCELEYQIKILGVGDQSLYNIKKAQLNSLYGMACQKKIKEDIKEVYEDSDELISGDYYIDDIDLKKVYEKNEKSYNNILPYVWGIYVTSVAMLHLFQLSTCINDVNYHWLYSDTDSIYSDNWNIKRIEAFNDRIKKKLIECGFGCIKIEDHEYWLGIAEPDGEYKEFITQGSKRYAVRNMDDSIKITVAGVPKKTGAACLRSLEDFQEGFIFPGSITGKTMHTYINEDIHIDANGNEVADSIDLTPADYTLSSIEFRTLEDLFTDEVKIPDYE